MSRKPHGIACPDCGGRLVIRTSRAEAPTCRQVSYQCAEAEICGATFGGVIEITHRIIVGLAPNPTVTLRAAPPRRVATPPPIAANDDGGAVPPAFNDNDVPDQAQG